MVARRVRRRRMRTLWRSAALLLVVAGLALLSSVWWELWGTGITTAHAQAHLRYEIYHVGFPRRAVPGGADGIIKIPRISLDMAFVEGVGAEDLAKGPGHYPETPMPGQAGNVAIAGHRTTHAAPFWALDTLQRGDEILLRTHDGWFVYQVAWVRVMPQGAWWVTVPTARPSLTLTTCHPRWSSTDRLVVRAVGIYGRFPGGFLDSGKTTWNVPAWGTGVAPR